jgi:hypothetical protein
VPGNDRHDLCGRRPDQMFDECAYDAAAEQIYMESLTRLAAVLGAHGKTYKLSVLFSHRQSKEKENGEIIKVSRRKSFTRTILVESCAGITINGPKRAGRPTSGLEPLAMRIALDV